MYPIKTNKKYIQSNLGATSNIYTTVYLGNYVNGDFREGVGSHCGVDMIPQTTGDNVFSILDGVIETVKENAYEGKYIIVKHTNAVDPNNSNNRTTIYSCYLHLSQINVTQGQAVKEGDIIGKTGNTGNSTGEHLHFQIDLANAPFHPYWPYTTKEAQDAGLGFMGAANAGLGIDKAKLYTINPLVYLNSLEGIQDSSTLIATAGASDSNISNSSNTNNDSIEIDNNTPVDSSVNNDSISSNNHFNDINDSNPYSKAINYLGTKGFAQGVNGNFMFDNSITRAELLKLVFLSGNIGLTTDNSKYFSDLDYSSWYVPYVNTAKSMGIIGGYPDGTFKPNNNITRTEGLKVIISSIYGQPQSSQFQVFSDVNSSDWFSPYANFAKSNNLMNFNGDKFEGDKHITRGEVANCIYRCLELKGEL